jgi:hypothetical protein
MAVLQAILAVLARSAGKLLSTVFGWATMLLFGKVPEERQVHLSIMALGSVVWLVVFLGVLFPALGVWLLTFVPLPGWLNETWVRLLMIVATVLVPPGVGWTALRMLDPEERPKEAAGRVKAVLKGYPYTLGLALTLVLMTLFAPFLKLRPLVRRWETQHVPVVVEANDYRDTVDRIQEALQEAGWRTERRQASWMLRVPTKVLTLLAGGAIENLVAEQLATLRGEALEVTLHPSDLVISGKEADVAGARAVLAEQLAFSCAHLTWTEEAQETEDRLEALWRQVGDGRTDGSPERRGLAVTRD